MQRAVLNRATMRVADTTEVSGRVTADQMVSSGAVKHCVCQPGTSLEVFFAVTANDPTQPPVAHVFLSGYFVSAQ
jgi:hypothetical protein